MFVLGGKLHSNEGAEFDRRRKAVLEQHKGIGAFAACRRVCITADADDMLRHALISIFVRLCKVFCLGGSALSAPAFFRFIKFAVKSPLPLKLR